MKTDSLKQIIEDVIKSEIKNAIVENTTAEVYIIKNKETGEPVEYCDTEQEANMQLDSYNAQGKEFIIEKGPKPSIDELDAMADENTNEMKQEKQPMNPIDEKLIGKQKNIDLNKNGELDKGDFAMLRNKKSELDEDWGSSDQGAMNKSIHRDLGEPESFPFDLDKVLSAAEDAVDFYWSDWEEYEEDRESLIQKAAQMYYRAYFRDTFEKMQQMFEPKRNTEDEVEEGEDCMECGDKMYEEEKTCNECGGMLNEEGTCNECGGGMMNESKKKIRLSESELVKLIKTIAESVPGLNAYQAAHKGSGKENDDAMSATEKKIKDYLSFDGNDNPEFPKQVGKGEKSARQNTSEEDEVVADNRGGGMEDLDYDVEPSKQFKERLKMALTGDSKMGNSHDAANVIPSDLGEKMMKKAERKNKEDEKAPMYVKDPAPVTNLNESVTKSNVLDEINRMKDMVNYNKKTQ
jgi:hypothetical protein